MMLVEPGSDRMRAGQRRRQRPGRRHRFRRPVAGRGGTTRRDREERSAAGGVTASARVGNGRHDAQRAAGGAGRLCRARRRPAVFTALTATTSAVVVVLPAPVGALCFSHPPPFPAIFLPLYSVRPALSFRVDPRNAASRRRPRGGAGQGLGVAAPAGRGRAWRKLRRQRGNIARRYALVTNAHHASPPLQRTVAARSASCLSFFCRGLGPIG